MSIFVSNSIKDTIDLDSLVDGNDREKIESRKNLKFFIECHDETGVINLAIKEIEKINNNSVRVRSTVNLSTFEKLFFKKVKLSKIIIGDTSCNVENFLFEKSVEKTYLYEVYMQLELEEETNV